MEKGIPYFLGEHGNLSPQEKYHIFLVQDCMDHSKFDELTQGPTGKVAIEKLFDEF